MQSQKTKTKIIQKVHQKNKLILKSVIPQSHQLMVCRFGYEDSILAAGYSDGQVRIYNMNTDNKICQINTNPSQKQITPVNCLRWRPANQDLGSISSVLLVANTNGTLMQYVAKTGKLIYSGSEENNQIMAMDYATHGKTFCTAGKDNVIRLYDEETKEISHKLDGVKWHNNGHNNRLFSVKFKPDDPNILVSGGWDQNVNIWDIRQGVSVSTLYGPKIAGDAIDIRQDHILTGANRGDNQVQLWDWKMKKVIKSYRWDQQSKITNAFIFCAQFCHHSKDSLIAVGSNQMKMFNIEEGNQILEVKVAQKTSLYSCDSGYTSDKYAIGGNSGSLHYMAGVKSYE